MLFLKQLSVAVALGFALVDARAVGFNGKRDVGAKGVTAGSNHPRAVDRPTGAKLRGRGLFGFGDDVEVNEDASKDQAEKCKEALNKLRKLRKLRKAKRAANGGLDVDEDLDDEHNWLGDESFTVQMGEHAYLSEEKADDHDLKFFGTVALDSCSGVLIVGDNGYTVAHLDPIGAADEAQTTPDQNSLQEFRANVASMVEADYNSNRDNLGNAVMYIMTPSDGLGEEGELTAAAQRMGIRISINKYDVVGEDGMDDDYYEKQRGTLYVNISDRDSPKVKANGDDPAPAA